MEAVREKGDPPGLCQKCLGRHTIDRAQPPVSQTFPSCSEGREPALPLPPRGIRGLQDLLQVRKLASMV